MLGPLTATVVEFARFSSGIGCLSLFLLSSGIGISLPSFSFLPLLPPCSGCRLNSTMCGNGGGSDGTWRDTVQPNRHIGRGTCQAALWLTSPWQKTRPPYALSSLYHCVLSVTRSLTEWRGSARKILPTCPIYCSRNNKNVLLLWIVYMYSRHPNLPTKANQILYLVNMVLRKKMFTFAFLYHDLAAATLPL